MREHELHQGFPLTGVQLQGFQKHRLGLIGEPFLFEKHRDHVVQQFPVGIILGLQNHQLQVDFLIGQLLLAGQRGDQNVPVAGLCGILQKGLQKGVEGFRIFRTGAQQKFGIILNQLLPQNAPLGGQKIRGLGEVDQGLEPVSDFRPHLFQVDLPETGLRPQKPVFAKHAEHHKPEKKTDPNHNPFNPQVVEMHLRQGHLVQEKQDRVAENQNQKQRQSGAYQIVFKALVKHLPLYSGDSGLWDRWTGKTPGPNRLTAAGSARPRF